MKTAPTHERSGQLAMGSFRFGGRRRGRDAHAAQLDRAVRRGRALTRHLVGKRSDALGAFIVLAGIAGLLLVPWLLKRMSIAADEELQTLGTGRHALRPRDWSRSGAGYSLALGAFLLGTIVAETHATVTQVERTFEEGMRDVVVQRGLLRGDRHADRPSRVDSRLGRADRRASPGLHAAGPSRWRPPAGLTLIGTPLKDALRTGLTATPIGEFSFIIAQFGVMKAVVPANFYPLAVGVSLLTTLAAPRAHQDARRKSPMSMLARGNRAGWVTGWLYYQELAGAAAAAAIAQPSLAAQPQAHRAGQPSVRFSSRGSWWSFPTRLFEVGEGGGRSRLAVSARPAR